MIFDGFSVDNIWGFRQHFSVKNLVGAIDNQFVLAKWFSVIKDSGSLDEYEERLVEEARHYFGLYGKNERCAEWAEFGRISADNQELAERMLDWEKNVAPERIGRYQNLMILLLKFLSLAKYTVSRDSEEEEIIFNYLLEEHYLKTTLLELKAIDCGRVGIYYGETLVTEMKCGPNVLRDGSMVFVASHPDTGFIGIDRSGGIVNGSAFHIPHIERKAVKAVLSQAAYVILLEDGKIVHNLRFTDLPEAPVKNIELYGEQLKWQLMDC